MPKESVAAEVATVEANATQAELDAAAAAASAQEAVRAAKSAVAMEAAAAARTISEFEDLVDFLDATLEDHLRWHETADPMIVSRLTALETGMATLAEQIGLCRNQLEEILTRVPPKVIVEEKPPAVKPEGEEGPEVPKTRRTLFI